MLICVNVKVGSNIPKWRKELANHALITMIRTLVESAFSTGYLSVESEGLLHQMLATKSYQSDDLAALSALLEAVRAGLVKREASSNLVMEFPKYSKYTKYNH